MLLRMLKLHFQLGPSSSSGNSLLLDCMPSPVGNTTDIILTNILLINEGRQYQCLACKNDGGTPNSFLLPLFQTQICWSKSIRNVQTGTYDPATNTMLVRTEG